MTCKMKALVAHAPNQYNIEYVQKPLCPDEGLLIRVKACGLCGSDLRTLKSGHKNITYPWISGHEVYGIIDEIGVEYHGKYKLGDELAVAPVVYCGECDFCISGIYELCENIKELAQTWRGGFAEYMVLPKEALSMGTIQKKPEELDGIIASVSEPISSCVNAQEKVNVSLGDTVVIIGTGPIGCIHISVARARGASTIIVADIFDERLKLCEPFKPDYKINSKDNDLVKEVMNITNGKGADIIITSNPVGSTQVQAVEMAKKGGRIALFGGLPHDNSKPSIDTNLIHYKGLHLVGTTTFAPRHQLIALELLATGRIPAKELITHILPLDDFEKGVELATKGHALKVVFIP